MNIREMRKDKGLTQKEASKLVGISLRSFINYENDGGREGSITYNYIVEALNKYGQVDEEHGILTLTKIKEECAKVLKEYPIRYCYLFGSYAKGKATGKSDVDLVVDSSVTGLDFYGLVEELREKLHKKVDVLIVDQVASNKELLNEVLKDGLKIYG
ncbi:MAG: nucleotidyltransferase domain-containing protein [Bacilli bacterium]|nr:nucleotidyltransferase domain-containing protein [Bacilli bacterium]